jgi:hypothetical protein
MRERRARQVRHDVGVDKQVVVDLAGRGVPARLVRPPRSTTDEPDDLVPLLRELVRPGASEEAGGARDDELHSDLELTGLEPLLHVAEKASGVGTIDQTVVVGQGQVDHVSYGNGLAEVLVVDHDRSLHDRARA